LTLRCADAADPGVCPEEDKERAKSDQYCGFLLSDSSPFKACKDSKTVDFNQMYSSCEFDVCSSDKDDVHLIFEFYLNLLFRYYDFHLLKVWMLDISTIQNTNYLISFD
jgi:hypothetical protein